MSDSHLPTNPDDAAPEQDPQTTSPELSEPEDNAPDGPAPAEADPWAEETSTVHQEPKTSPFWLMSSIIALAIMGLLVLWLQNRHLQARLNQATGKTGATVPAKTIRISGEIDGTGVFHFTERTVSYEHRNWDEPTAMTFDGEPWDDLHRAPKSWQETAPKLDLSRARIISRKGRDVISLEPTDKGFDLYLADSPGGSDNYEVTISVPMKR